MNDPNERNVTKVCIKRDQGDAANTNAFLCNLINASGSDSCSRVIDSILSEKMYKKKATHDIN